ncbi:hypothetical protein J19TS2_54720 [Cohnella xylanilytica]|nr:hypothetical protein J19TS2_54720 [Cohnella xylanilytica]
MRNMDAASGNMRMVGTTQSGGGKFRHVRITGESELVGRTECESIACTGTLKVKGDLQSGRIKLTGELTVEGDLKAGRAGMTGQADVRGSWRGEELRLNGSLIVKGDLESEACLVRGAASVGGLLSAETVELRMFGSSAAKEVGGGTITVKRSRMGSIKTMFTSSQPAFFTAELIEGDRLDLEHTKARVVRGNQVRIGPGCDIGRVEYRRSLSKSNGASVGSEAKID